MLFLDVSAHCPRHSLCDNSPCFTHRVFCVCYNSINIFTWRKGKPLDFIALRITAFHDLTPGHFPNCIFNCFPLLSHLPAPAMLPSSHTPTSFRHKVFALAVVSARDVLSPRHKANSLALFIWHLLREDFFGHFI